MPRRRCERRPRATGWIDQDTAFEASVHAAVDAAYDNPSVREVLAAIDARITAPSWSNSLSQKLVQLTMPGIPDVYQGTELWDDSLVDPDNRRPVDFADRATRLRALFAPEHAGQQPVGGDAKLWVVAQALRARRDRPELFTGYQPLLADGVAANHLIGFDRGGAITLATRLPVALASEGGWAGEWANTSVQIPDGQYVDVLTGATIVGGPVALSDVFTHLPVALLLETRECLKCECGRRWRKRFGCTITEPDSQRVWTRPLAPVGDGWFSADVLEASRRSRLRLSLGRRRANAARPAITAPAGRRPRTESFL